MLHFKIFKGKNDELVFISVKPKGGGAYDIICKDKKGKWILMKI